MHYYRYYEAKNVKVSKNVCCNETFRCYENNQILLKQFNTLYNYLKIAVIIKRNKTFKFFL